MNAYELADINDWSCCAHVKEVSSMLRQQADRIAHLEMLLANRNEIIDKLDLTTSQIKKHCEPLCKPSLCDCFKKANEK